MQVQQKWDFSFITPLPILARNTEMHVKALSNLEVQTSGCLSTHHSTLTVQKSVTRAFDLLNIQKVLPSFSSETIFSFSSVQIFIQEMLFCTYSLARYSPLKAEHHSLRLLFIQLQWNRSDLGPTCTDRSKLTTGRKTVLPEIQDSTQTSYLFSSVVTT